MLKFLILSLLAFLTVSNANQLTPISITSGPILTVLTNITCSVCDNSLLEGAKLDIINSSFSLSLVPKANLTSNQNVTVLLFDPKAKGIVAKLIGGKLIGPLVQDLLITPNHSTVINFITPYWVVNDLLIVFVREKIIYGQLKLEFNHEENETSVSTQVEPDFINPREFEIQKKEYLILGAPMDQSRNTTDFFLTEFNVTMEEVKNDDALLAVYEGYLNDREKKVDAQVKLIKNNAINNILKKKELNQSQKSKLIDSISHINSTDLMGVQSTRLVKRDPAAGLAVLLIIMMLPLMSGMPWDYYYWPGSSQWMLMVIGFTWSVLQIIH